MRILTITQPGPSMRGARPFLAVPAAPLHFGFVFEDPYRRDGLILQPPAGLGARSNPKRLSRTQHSGLLVDLAPHLEDFLGDFFGISREIGALQARHHSLAPLNTVKRKFVQNRANCGELALAGIAPLPAADRRARRASRAIKHKPFSLSRLSRIAPANIRVQLLDRLFVRCHDPFHQIADRGHAHHLLALRYRQMTDAMFRHNAHAFVHGIVG